jgi:hypothetical protein
MRYSIRRYVTAQQAPVPDDLISSKMKSGREGLGQSMLVAWAGKVVLPAKSLSIRLSCGLRQVEVTGILHVVDGT